ncbi:MAG TPA: CDP-alcohol phosphatidyltransferase family protein [Actinomycetota bacterium]|nr:CDP-alcohol phosphatidyltransferase family protein [Actinomycetota bacterium]
MLRSTVQRITLPIGKGIAAVGLTPNAVTVIGSIVTLYAGWLISQGNYRTGGVMALVAGVFDSLDGAVARARGGSQRGAFLDSTLDRVSDAVLFAAVIWASLDTPAPVALAMAAMVLGFMTSYIRARAEGLGLECRVGLAERAERVIILAIGLITGFVTQSLVILVILSSFTVIQRFVHVWRQARADGT